MWTEARTLRHAERPWRGLAGAGSGGGRDSVMPAARAFHHLDANVVAAHSADDELDTTGVAASGGLGRSSTAARNRRCRCRRHGLGRDSLLPNPGAAVFSSARLRVQIKRGGRAIPA